MDNRKKLTAAVVVVLLLGVSFFSGARYGRQNSGAVTPPVVDNSSAPGDVHVDFGPFWKAWETIDQKFVPTSTSSKVSSSQERVWGAVGGLVDSLGDPYSVFMPPAEAEIFESDISGNFTGVGMEIGVHNDILTVIAPLKNTPAYRAGILPGDEILKIDDTTTDKLNTDEAVKLIRGKAGTKVRLTILRDSKPPFEVSIARANIDIPTLDYNMRGDGVFVIRLYNFSANSPDLFRAALRQFVRTGSDKLVLDLRGNPGGFLEAAVDMASWFLPAGKVIVREAYKDGRDETVHRSRGYDIFSNKLKMAVLIDGGSASAAEILAGALSEQSVAKLIGEQSFGKGSVQQLFKITPDSSLKLTIAQWLTPNGKSISANGLVPATVVKRTDDDIKKGMDPQLAAAVSYVLK